MDSWQVMRLDIERPSQSSQAEPSERAINRLLLRQQKIAIYSTQSAGQQIFQLRRARARKLGHTHTRPHHRKRERENERDRERDSITVYSIKIYIHTPCKVNSRFHFLQSNSDGLVHQWRQRDWEREREKEMVILCILYSVYSIKIYIHIPRKSHLALTLPTI